jgi:hypothetical protein
MPSDHLRIARVSSLNSQRSGWLIRCNANSSLESTPILSKMERRRFFASWTEIPSVSAISAFRIPARINRAIWASFAVSWFDVTRSRIGKRFPPKGITLIAINILCAPVPINYLVSPDTDGIAIRTVTPLRALWTILSRSLCAVRLTWGLCALFAFG